MKPTPATAYGPHVKQSNLLLSAMSMYEMHPASLGDIEGQGYAFQRKTVWGKATHGVFFPHNEEEVEGLEADAKLPYEGMLYLMTTERETEEEVAVKNVMSTRSGLRVTFESVDNPDEAE